MRYIVDVSLQVYVEASCPQEAYTFVDENFDYFFNGPRDSGLILADDVTIGEPWEAEE